VKRVVIMWKKKKKEGRESSFPSFENSGASLLKRGGWLVKTLERKDKPVLVDFSGKIKGSGKKEEHTQGGRRKKWERKGKKQVRFT